MAQIKRIGFGQVEPNHLSAQKTAQLYAQLKANADIAVLENGQYVKYDYANNEVNFTGAGEWMMVFNEVKLYDGYRVSYKDFAMIKGNYTVGSDFTHEGYGPFEGQMTPRVIKINIGDIYTTNCLGMANTDGKAEVEGIEVEVGDVLSPNAKGYLEAAGEDAAYKLQVVKIYTMPDGQAAVKLMRIA